MDIDTIYLLLPAYNEEENIIPLVQEASKVLEEIGLPYKIVIVDDGSSDRTYEKCQEANRQNKNVICIKNERNMGLGGAMKRGIKYLIEEEKIMPNSVVITMDADRTQSPKSIKFMLNEVKNGAKIVIASRYVEGSTVEGVPPTRSLASNITRKVCSMLWGKRLPIKDFTCNYRLYSGDVLHDTWNKYGEESITFTRSFVAPLELLVKTSLFANKVTEVPIYLNYSLRGDQSKLPPFKTLIDLAKFFFYKIFTSKIP